MSFSHRKVIKVLTLLFAFYVSQVYVGTAKSLPIAAKLRVYGNSKLILIDGNKVGSGNTILSGAELRTPKGARATVELSSLGRLDLAPETNLRVTFSEGIVSVYLKAGRVVLTTKKGVNGSVTSCEQKVVRTDPTQLSSAITVTAACRGAGAALIKATTAAGFVSAGAASALGNKVQGNDSPCKRASNPSPSRPCPPPSDSERVVDCDCGRGNQP